MHAKTDSEGTSIEAASSWAPPRTAARPLYYVQSPSNHDVEKMSFGSGCSPMASPAHPHFYHCSPIHHSRESSTSRFSDSLKPHPLFPYKSLRLRLHAGDLSDDGDSDSDGDGSRNLRLYLCLFVSFLVLFTLFSLILWGASKSYPPKVIVKGIVFENMNVQAGNDRTGVTTDMLTMNSTVRFLFRNPSTFFAVHVTSSPFLFHYSQLTLASGQMKKFTQPRKSQRSVVTVVQGHQVPLYGGISVLSSQHDHLDRVSLPLNLTMVLRSRAYILGRLVKSKFYTKIRCPLTLHANRLGKPMRLHPHSCLYSR
ncbi:PREDICTED: uncharacterized protein LOC104824744 [Tarenaya hassleriana]|uniref:uncharacterized protein LOC104824744 n=1 Tax=Tarenaya hassleriana TaxID=28532 RepID=UPI00053C680A|nr:PREDICTED: uncharacterized protein LOC104824744 [Tarenaya hassleriana]